MLEHHKEHSSRNREINQFCLKYWEFPYRCTCIVRHYPIWAGSCSRVPQPRSLHINTTGDEVRGHSCLISKIAHLTKTDLKSLMICYQIIIRVNYNRKITDRYTSCLTTWEYRPIPCCSILTARFSNLTKFECSHMREAITYTHDIFRNECKRLHLATWKISILYIENNYHHLTLQKQFRLLLNKVVIMHRCKSIKCLISLSSQIMKFMVARVKHLW